MEREATGKHKFGSEEEIYFAFQILLKEEAQIQKIQKISLSFNIPSFLIHFCVNRIWIGFKFS